MAKINFGGVVQDARGKQNGIVYSKNKSGAYVRKKVTPVNPNTALQAAVRSTFAGLAKAWSGSLNAATRAQWNAFAATYPRTDVFGNAISLNGLNQYISINQALLNAGQAELESPPASVYTPPISVEPGSLEATFATGIIEFDQTNADDGTGDLYYLFATPNLPVGRTAVKANYRYIGTSTQSAGSGAPVSITDQWATVFGSGILGQRIYLAVSTISPMIGIPTVAQILTAIWG